MVEAVLAVDAEENLVRLNDAARRLFFREGGDPVGRSLPEATRNPDLLRFVRAALAADEPVSADLTLREEDERFLQGHATPLRDAAGGRIGALVVLHDVTQIRRLENVRRDFVANVSHELKTPVTSIQGFVETLRDGALDDSHTARRFLEIVARHADRLNAIIEDLLSLSRLESDAERHEIALAPGAIRPVLAAALLTCANKAAERNIAIELQCDEGLRANINAALLEQAIVNLLDNAVKYSKDGALVKLEGLEVEGEAVIRVADQGCGISKEHLPRIFERFYRVDKARSRDLGGTGLGLAIVKHIVNAHGGRVAVKSGVNQGSEFSVQLPATTG
jgi:two-component system phosphate regulon sensor histidine kinase PhoR